MELHSYTSVERNAPELVGNVHVLEVRRVL
jgi:hypothetical protein